MKRINVILLFIFCLTSITPVHGQNFASYDRFQMDSLQHSLSLKKNKKDSILALQKLVDFKPVHSAEADKYPDHLSLLLKLNKTEKVFDPLPYELLQKGDQQWSKKQFREALASLQAAVSSFDKQHKEIYILLQQMRLLYNNLNDQEARLAYYQNKLEYYLINGPFENTAPCLHSIAGYYNNKGAYNQAINYYLRAADVYARFNIYASANSTRSAGSRYLDWGNSKKGATYLRKGTALLKKWKNAGNNVDFHVNVDGGAIALVEGRYADALEFTNKALESRERFAYTETALALLLSRKASIYLKMNQAAAALPLLKRARVLGDSIALQISSAAGPFEIDYFYYEYYAQIGNFAMAEKSLLQAAKLAAEATEIPLQQKYLKELGYFYQKQNKPVLAAGYFDQLIKLTDAHEKSLDEFKVAQYETDRNDRLQQEHINHLKQEKALQEYELSRRNALLWFALAVVLVVSCLLVFIYRQLNTNKKTLASLRQTQNQLIQAEKMASLGELTAGIAHEIQNPLNFVNNFSEVNTELIDEMHLEIEKGNYEEVKAIASDIKDNQQKISQHGKRADFIVKGMLQHSRTNTGERQLTDINILADEFLKLSYHGLRAKDKSFNAVMLTNFSEALPQINIVQQDIGRVLLNLFNNAFYAVNEKKKTHGDDYQPEVSISTSVANDQVVICVKDNGIGIPDAVKEKIMQPFFTTKPAGQGTGLGLSLSYDIVVKGHGGEIEIDTREGEFTEFKVLFRV